MRPLMVRGWIFSRPLSWRHLPVWGCRGGGKSRLRGVESQLHSGLVSGLSEDAEQVADLLLAGVDDLAGGGLVNGCGDVLTESLELAVQLRQQVVGRQLG